MIGIHVNGVFCVIIWDITDVSFTQDFDYIGSAVVSLISHIPMIQLFINLSFYARRLWICTSTPPHHTLSDERQLNDVPQ